MMRTISTIACFALLAATLPAQSPPKGGDKVTATGGQEKGKTGATDKKADGKQDKKQDGKGQVAKGGKSDPKKDGSGKTGGKTKDNGKDIVKVAETEKDEIPRGTDPADLAAQKSARDMLAAEKRLAELLKAGKIKGIDQVLPFEEIASWPYEDGLKGMPKKLSKLNGKKVMMTGFMLPIDEVENIKEFLLVQSLWSCCYGQPPDINGTVRVVMQGKHRIDYKFEPIKVIGTFRIKPTIEDGFCVDIYQLETKDVEVIK